MTDTNLLSAVVTEVLRNTPYRPFLCLPLSALLYAQLKDQHNVDAKLITGDLSYRGESIFKQDYKISEAKADSLATWAGHAWVEVGGIICDLSFCRTLYSSQFSKSFKKELIAILGEGRGGLIFSKTEGNPWGLRYNGIDNLSDNLATGIIKGFQILLK